MKKYFIIRPDGSSVFLQPYPFDFCMHCLFLLLDSSDEHYQLLNFADVLSTSSVQLERGTGDQSPVFASLDLQEQKNILKYILK